MARQVEIRSYNEYSKEESIFNLELKGIILTPEEIKKYSGSM